MALSFRAVSAFSLILTSVRTETIWIRKGLGKRHIERDKLPVCNNPWPLVGMTHRLWPGEQSKAHLHSGLCLSHPDWLQ